MEVEVYTQKWLFAIKLHVGTPIYRSFILQSEFL